MKTITVYTLRTVEIEETWVVEVPNYFIAKSDDVENDLLKKIEEGDPTRVTLWSEDRTDSDIEVTSYEEED